MTVAVLSPFVTGKVSVRQASSTARTCIGWVAFVVSLGTTSLSGRGVYYMVEQGHSGMMPAMILGAAAAATFLKEVPVRPLISGGVIYLIARLAGTVK